MNNIIEASHRFVKNDSRKLERFLSFLKLFGRCLLVIFCLSFAQFTQFVKARESVTEAAFDRWVGNDSRKKKLIVDFKLFCISVPMGRSAFMRSDWQERCKRIDSVDEIISVKVKAEALVVPALPLSWFY